MEVGLLLGVKASVPCGDEEGKLLGFKASGCQEEIQLLGVNKWASFWASTRAYRVMRRLSLRSCRTPESDA